MRAVFTKGDSRSAVCQWHNDYPHTMLFRLYPYEHQERKAKFPYRVVGFDFKLTTHICVRTDISRWQQLRLQLLYWLGVLKGDFRPIRKNREYGYNHDKR
jgi:hypothetical protein